MEGRTLHTLLRDMLGTPYHNGTTSLVVRMRVRWVKQVVSAHKSWICLQIRGDARLFSIVQCKDLVPTRAWKVTVERVGRHSLCNDEQIILVHTNVLSGLFVIT